jgi:ketosteroid isomerase-like protein
MSQENVEVVKAAFEAWNAGDWDAVPELFDPNVVIRPSDDWPEAGPFVGVEAVTRWFGQLRETSRCRRRTWRSCAEGSSRSTSISRLGKSI